MIYADDHAALAEPHLTEICLKLDSIGSLVLQDPETDTIVGYIQKYEDVEEFLENTTADSDLLEVLDKGWHILTWVPSEMLDVD